MTRPLEMPSRKSRGFPTIPLSPVVRPESLLSLWGAVYDVNSLHNVSGGESGNELIWECLSLRDFVDLFSCLPISIHHMHISE